VAIAKGKQAANRPIYSVVYECILEYEAVGKREAQRLKIPESIVEAIIRAFSL
jgi:hypothetical protein